MPEATDYFDENVEDDKIVLQTWLQLIQDNFYPAVEKFGSLSLPKAADALRQFLDR